MGVDTEKQKFAVFNFFEQPFFPQLKSVCILNPTCSGVYQAAHEVGGGYIGPPQLFWGSRNKSAIFGLA